VKICLVDSEIIVLRAIIKKRKRETRKKLTQAKYTVSQKNDNDVPHYNFNANQPILIIFGRDIAE